MENATQTNRRTTQSKSPLELAKVALEAAREAIPQYSSRFSRHDYTQHQLYALVALRRLLRTDYRGLEATLHDWTELRDALGLSRVPDHSTIQRAERRLKTKSRSKSRPRTRPDSAPASQTEGLPLFDRTESVATPALAAAPATPISCSAA